MSLTGLPVLMRVAGRAVMLLGEGEAADAKRRLLERAGARIVGENETAALAIVAIDDEVEAIAAIDRLKARGILVNAVDRPALCDFTLPAIVDRDPVLIAVSTGGVSAGLAAALRQRLETLLPASLGSLARSLGASRDALTDRFPDGGERRRAIAAALDADAILDPLIDHPHDAVASWLGGTAAAAARIERIAPRSTDPDELTLREARLLGSADRIFHRPGIPPALLDRARADAARIEGDAPATPLPGLTIDLELPA